MADSRPTPAKKILIVDDDLDTLKLVGTTLEKQGFVIFAAKDGKEALAKIAENVPDLVLLDIMMPEMDGYEVTRRLRANPETAQLPIILFTAKGQVEDKVAGLDVGANEYLTKPTHPAELIARVRNLLNRPVSNVFQSPRVRATTTLPTVIGIMAGKGGQGVSTLAVNLATAFQQQFTGAKVLFAELRPGCGDIGIQFGYKNPQGLNELLKKNNPDIHRGVVENSLITHKSGLRMLLSSNQPSDVGLFSNGEQMSSIVRELSRIAPYLVLDLGVGLHTTTEKALDQCTKLIIVVEPDPHTMPHTKSLIENLKEIGFSANKIIAVMVHRVRTEQAMNAADLQRELGLEISAVFTPAPELAYQAAQIHQSMLTVEPESFTAQQTKKLAKLIIEPVPA
jgi:CheY-like chemotaxis protein/MinD-like ATPase involved in chromosome partitioning or flagellar assembly